MEMKPIETAPKDGTKIVLWDGDEFITIGCWVNVDIMDVGGYWKYPNWEMDDFIDFKYWTDKPVSPEVVMDERKKLYIEYLRDALNNSLTGEQMKPWQMRSRFSNKWRDIIEGETPMIMNSNSITIEFRIKPNTTNTEQD